MNTFKVVLLGDSGVGKTSLIKRYIFNKFEITENMTIGSSFFPKQIIHKYKNNEHEINLHIWDTAGQERFRSMLPMYIRNSHIVLIIFDSRNINNIIDYFNNWINFVRDHNTENILVYLIGSKRDLVKISELDCDILYKLDLDRKNICFISAKTGQCIDELFNKILNDIIENNMIKTNNDNINIQ
jgi:small GTP-binding protein